MKYTKKILENGLRILLIPQENNETVTVMVLAEAGSEYETKLPKGISHFLEHMCFKGTSRRPHSSIINHELDSLGSISNAFTDKDCTGYYAKTHHSKLSNILDIVSDIYLNSTFPEVEIEKEKGVVIEEINMYEDDSRSKVWEVLDEAMYEGQPPGHPILGSKESVASITREDLLSYHQDFYVPEATTIVISGKINEEQVFSEVQEIFGKIPFKKKTPKPQVNEDQSKPVVKINYKKNEQTHVVISFRSFNMYDERFFAGSLLGSILGSGMSSRLFEIIREKLGLAYYVGAGNSASIDYGRFNINMGVSNDKVALAVEAVFEELNKIKKELVSDDELKKVKEMRKGKMFLGLESSDQWADFYGFQEVYHENIMSPENILDAREKVTVEDIQKLAKEIFIGEKLTIAVVGPVEDPHIFDKALKMLE